MRWSAAASASAVVVSIAMGILPAEAAAQSSTLVTQGRLASVFPEADRFSEKEGEPPVYRAYGSNPETGAESLLGFAFLTEDVPPEREGYDAPIRVLVGMDLEGTLTGIRVMSYRESLRGSRGDFLREPGVQEQFAGKSIRDPFRIRGDVRNVTGATITTRAMARGIRNAARRVAAAYLLDRDEDGESSPPPRIGTIPLDELEPLLWAEMAGLGLVAEVSGEVGREVPLQAATAYLRDRAMVEAFLGSSGIEDLLADARERSPEGHFFFLGLNGPDVVIFSASRIAFEQDGDTIGIERRDFLGVRGRSSGKAAGEFQRAGLLVVDPALDVRRPFRFVVDLARDRGTVSAIYQPFGMERTAVGPGEPEGAAATGDEATDRGSTASTADAPEPAEMSDDTGGADAVAGASVAAESGASESDPTAADLAPQGASPSPAPSTPAAGAGPAAPPAGPGGPDLTEEELLELLVSEDVKEETGLSRILAETHWPRVIWLLLLLSLATVAFALKHAVLRWIALAGTLAFLGFVDGGFLSVSHIVAGISVGPAVFLEDLSLLILVGFTIVTTLFWGRVFCGFLCPFGVLQDLLEKIVPSRFRLDVPRAIHERALGLKYVILAVILAPPLLGISITIYYWFEPFGTVFFRSSSLVLWAIALGVLAASAVIPRFYCRYACPLGAALAVGSLLSPFRIRRVEQCEVCVVCERTCPTGAIRQEAIDFKECVRCNECEIRLAERAGVCRHDMDEIRPRLVQLTGPRAEPGLPPTDRRR